MAAGAREATKRLYAIAVPATTAAMLDKAIGAYFTLFPLLVAAFLSVQAVRAHDADIRGAQLGPAAAMAAR